MQTETYYQRNRSACIKRALEYKAKHPDKVKRYNDNYYTTSQRHTPIADYRAKVTKPRTKSRERRRISKLVTRIVRGRLTPCPFIGCTTEEFKSHIEKKFSAGMSWENYKKFWQIDHITPTRDFNLTDPNEFLKAVHFTNCQPLTIEDHQKKSKAESLRNSTHTSPSTERTRPHPPV